MDQRYYLSLLTLGAILVVAWGMSQFHDDRLIRSSSDSSAKSASSEIRDDSHRESTSRTLADLDSPARKLADADVQPLIPGLLDEPERTLDAPATSPLNQMSNSPSNMERSAVSELSNTPNNIGPTHGLTGVPLRRVSAASDSEREMEGNRQPPPTNESIVTEDGSGPSSRVVPTFSMPNTQAPSLERKPSLSNEPSNQPIANQESNTTAPSLRPINGDRYRALEDQVATPQPLPGERHVLRPINRSKPPVSGPPPVNAPPSASEFPPVAEAKWDGPMPGMKPRAQNTGGGFPLRRENRDLDKPTAPIFNQSPSDSNSTTPMANGLASDPLFVQVGTESGPNGAPLSQANNGSGQPMVRQESQARPPQSPVTSRGLGRARPRSGDYIWHVIQPDQSLESISRQYQGDGSLVPKLLDLNSDLLTDPALLPVGTAIRIPVR